MILVTRTARLCFQSGRSDSRSRSTVTAHRESCAASAGFPEVSDQPAVTPDGTGRGDRAVAFARYVEPEIAVLYRVALTLAGQRADAEDLV